MEIEILTVSSSETEVAFVNGRPIDIRFPTAFLEAKKKMVRRFFEKGNSWMTSGVDFLVERLEDEWNEWKETGNPLELLDVMNLAAMVHDVIVKEEGNG